MSQPIITIDDTIRPLPEQLEREQVLVQACRKDTRARIMIWRAEPTLVVTKPESRLPEFETAKNILSAKGWPITVRGTGGAAVPQSPQTMNLSIIYQANTQFNIDASYQLLCQPMIEAFAQLGIASHTGEVQGSFCDGKYNLAVTEGTTIKKVVGTSQKWTSDKIVLSHAVILTSIDTDAATQHINEFYRLAGSDEVKNPHVVTSLQKHTGSNLNVRHKLTEALASCCEQLTFN